MKKVKILNTKAEEISERTVRFMISSEVVDRDGDILVAGGCDFTNFAKNPQFLGFHNSHDFPLGIPKNWEVKNNAVYCDVYFPTIEELSTNPDNASEKAKLVDFTYHCYKTGMLNAVSVGFIAKDYDANKETGGLVINKWELLEFSAVAVPANQDAIAQAVKSFGEDGAKMMITKTGKRISAETKKTLDAIKACNERVKNCLKEIKECEAEMETLLATLDNAEELIDDETEPQTDPQTEEDTLELDDEKEIDLESI